MFLQFIHSFYTLSFLGDGLFERFLTIGSSGFCSFLLFSLKSILLLFGSNFVIGEITCACETEGKTNTERWAELLILKDSDSNESQNNIFGSSSNVYSKGSTNGYYQEDIHGDDESEATRYQQHTLESYIGASKENIVKYPEIS